MNTKRRESPGRGITTASTGFRTVRRFRVFLALPFLALGALADPFGTNLTLESALQYGAENNPKLQAAFNQWKGAEQNIAVQKGLPDPMLTYGYYFDSVETRVGPQNQAFGLAQKFPAFGKLGLQKTIAADQAGAAAERYRREKLNLGSTIALAYAELYFLKRSIDITQERIVLVRDLEQVARARYKAGAPLAATLQAQVELGRLEDRLNSLNDLRQPQTARLNAALNRPRGTNLPWPASLPYRAAGADADALRKNLHSTSPELAELASDVAMGAHRVQLARRERLPDFTLGVQYIDTGNAAMPVADSGKDPLIGTIGINLPLWIGKNRARVAAAEYQRTAAQRMLENRAQTLDADIRQTLFNLRDADRKIILYKQNLIPKAEQSLEVSRKAYEAGQLEFINLIDAERMLLEFDLASERALADHLVARAELSRLTGVDFLTGENHEPR